MAHTHRDMQRVQQNHKRRFSATIGPRAPLIPVWTEHTHYKTSYVARSREQVSKRKPDESSEEQEDEKKTKRMKRKMSSFRRIHSHQRPTSLRRNLKLRRPTNCKRNQSRRARCVKKIERLRAKKRMTEEEDDVNDLKHAMFSLNSTHTQLGNMQASQRCH
eukprot:476898-Amphidinium_carterae.2